MNLKSWGKKEQTKDILPVYAFQIQLWLKEQIFKEHSHEMVHKNNINIYPWF